ncbi:hypothetical protein D9613_004640 [Agrocybe pediades]|uniref:F-box domain-containing protein n=1 Tax=Agrocybe pediades TaxID=84607 RepID=A0A8H4VRD4_9AGAR|nr:hypothetical protein D9613_004640 [Agrocybe pediades]
MRTLRKTTSLTPPFAQPPPALPTFFSPPSSSMPILNGAILNHDILWTIFTLIGQDREEAMDDRLACILNATAVCKHWRQIILPSSNIWCLLIYVDRQYPWSRRASPQLLQTVCARSGRHGLLHIEATGCENVSLDLRQILLHFLNENWSRVARLSIGLDVYAYSEFVFRYPAPNVRWLQVTWTPDLSGTPEQMDSREADDRRQNPPRKLKALRGAGVCMDALHWLA